ncbi:Acetyltransferase (GNAT) family protein [Salinibacillus kushneri]|uniref:Acetyltransferase (GNAT) family protein n=1 Tax=Salinibacillus kushneri TaxID=237682 RepID=A0A1I0ILJ2_9BACI|nr:GNAT family N-acetyltransferase [Salinibacillus kushneri]SET94082.1 Acetyltransferase (GNAT) family protein [Salinibacillus kushneri]SET97925.1 Acetyltransferase (GNAT) family protein [Salinibacillus kushneri]
METMTIKELDSKEEIRKAYPLMKQLRTHLDEETYLDLVLEAMENDRYKMAVLYDSNKLVAVTGFKPMITLYYGRFVWVCDLVTDVRNRSNGYGRKLLSFVEKWAKEHQYERIALSSGLHRKDAHQFYEEKMDYYIASYVLKKDFHS